MMLLMILIVAVIVAFGLMALDDGTFKRRRI